MTIKEMAKKIIDSLPEDASIDQVMHALYVHRKFAKGEQEIIEGKGITQEEAKRRLAKWQK